ncbi:MAG: hypothetical protein LUQ65_04780 [Candidatus Helarchaeota archaeon]|nr:hypothetical protein [Candidatus Helarchaeota archaeon]
MDSHLKYIIAGGVVGGEGGTFLLLGVEFAWIQKLLGLTLFSPVLLWIFIIIGTASLIVGGTFLLIGLIKYRKQNQMRYEKL